MSAAVAQEIAKLTVDYLKGMRNDDVFMFFFQLLESLQEKTDTEEATLPRRIKHLDIWKLGKEKATIVPLKKSITA